MYIQSVDNKIKEEMKAEYIKSAKEFAKDGMENDEGCLKMEVYEDIERLDHVFIISVWDSQEHMEKSQAFLRHKADLKPAFLGNKTTIMKTV